MSFVEYAIFATTFVVVFVAFIIFELLRRRRYKQRFESIFTLEEAEGSSSQKRIIILKDAWSIFIDHPIGVGVGAFPFVRMKYFKRGQDTHNLYFEVATNLGIQGLVVFFLMIAKQFSLLRGVSSRLNDKYSKLIANRNNLSDESASEKNIFDIQLLMATSQAVFYFILARLYPSLIKSLMSLEKVDGLQEI